MTFQQAVEALQAFWASQGCVIEFPYDVEVGAGTMHPASFLRVLGPEPWKIAFVQPSRRPADSRYGDNPYRLYRHYQYQVVLKPAPANAQELYLDSLRALGFDLRHHDLRFMADDWGSPTLAAAGVGWQVWLNGLEITQFTYFQIAGGLELSPVPVEITYGLERVCMTLQNVNHYRQIRWSDGVTYGELYRQAEHDWGRYALDQADAEFLRALFDACEREASRLLDEENVIPAYDYTLRCSHLFNGLEARKAISVTQRTGYVERVRALARRCARGYLRQRESLGFPLLRHPPA